MRFDASLHMRFDVSLHRSAWHAIDSLSLRNPDLEPVGGIHNGLEEILTKCSIDKVRDYLIMEIGTELGGSTRFFCDFLPNSSIVCIDPWPAAYKIPKALAALSPDLQRQGVSLYELFLYFCKHYKDRILPIRAFSNDGIVRVYRMGLIPDIVYVDGDHRYLGVLNDLILVHSLFPSAVIVGDDWNFSSRFPVYKGIDKSVRKAAMDFCDHFGLSVESIRNTYVIQPNLERERVALEYTTQRHP